MAPAKISDLGQDLVSARVEARRMSANFGSPVDIVNSTSPFTGLCQERGLASLSDGELKMLCAEFVSVLKGSSSVTVVKDWLDAHFPEEERFCRFLEQLAHAPAGQQLVDAVAHIQ